MNWLTDFLKHLEISKTFTCALFLTSIVVLVGPEILPGKFDPVPPQYHWFVVALGILSFALLAIWLLQQVPGIIASGRTAMRGSRLLNPLTPREEIFLTALAHISPNASVSIWELNVDNIQGIELVAVRDALEARGMIECAFDNEYISFTPKGRKIAVAYVQQRET